MNDLNQAAEQIAEFMRTLTTTGGMKLKFRITAGAGAADPNGFERRDIYVECKGPDEELLLENDAELLRSLEHVAAKILRLEPQDHDRVSFDADGYKAERAEDLKEMAEDGIDSVDDTEKPFSFPPMNSRERRMLHMFLKESGLRTASSGEGARRFVVLYPDGYTIPEERPTFRRNGDRGRSGSRGNSGGYRGGNGNGGNGSGRGSSSSRY